MGTKGGRNIMIVYRSLYLDCNDGDDDDDDDDDDGEDDDDDDD